MKGKTCCFIGHRSIPANEFRAMQKRLEAEIVNLTNQGVTNFCSGGALGFDAIAALTVLKLRPQFQGIRLIFMFPCKEQTKCWLEEDIRTYNSIMNQADETVYLSERYHKGYVHKRNRRLVDRSSVCICYLTKEKDSAAYTVGYAMKKRVRIIQLKAPSPGKPRQSPE